MLCAHKLDSYRTDISIRVLCFGFNHNLYLHGFSFDSVSIDVFDSVCVCVCVFQFSGHIKRILNWHYHEWNERTSEQTIPTHKQLIRLMPWYFPHYSMRVTKLKPTDEYGKNMCYNNNNFPASFLLFLCSPMLFGPDNGIFARSPHIRHAVAVAIIVFAWFVLFHFIFCFSFHFLTLLNMFAHVMVAWCMPVSGHIQHDAKLWRAKTTTSPMGKSQYFISFWQARWF